MMEKRNRIARALSNTDISGPDDFDLAGEYEKNMYDRMALAALNAQHVFAVHTVEEEESFSALSALRGTTMTITFAGDSYVVWGEEAGPEQARHMVIGVDTVEDATAVVSSLNTRMLPATVTSHEDWAEVVEPVHVDYTWGQWMQDTKSW